MKSINSLVNTTLLKNNLKRFWVLSLFYFLFTFLLGPFVFLMNKSSGLITSVNDGSYEWFREILHFQSTGFGVLFFTVIFAFILGIALNSQMTERGQMVFVHSLPTTKLCNYITSLVSTIALIFIPLFFNCCLMALLKLVFGFSAYRYVHVLYFMYELAVAMIVVYSFTALIGTLCGTKLFTGLLTIFFGTLPMLIYLSWGAIASQFVPGYVFNIRDINMIINFSPLVKIFCLQDKPYTLISSIVYILASFGFTTIGYYIYKKRKNEKATDPLAFELPKPILKYLITALVAYPMAIAFAEITSYSRTATYIGAIFGIFVGYFVTEMFIQKNFNVWNKWKGFVLSVFAFVLVVIVLKTGAFGFVNYIPAEDEIEAVLVSSNTYEYDYYTYESYDFLGHEKNSKKLNIKFSSDEEYIKLTRDYHEALIESNYSRFLYQRAVNKHGYAETFIINGKPANLQCETITYKMKNGKIIEREYYHNIYETAETESKVKSCEGFKRAEFKKIFDILDGKTDCVFTGFDMSNVLLDSRYSIYLEDEDVIADFTKAVMDDYLNSTYDPINKQSIVECGVQFISKSELEKQAKISAADLKDKYAYEEIAKYAQDYYSLPMITEQSSNIINMLDEYAWKDLIIPCEKNVQEFRIYKFNSAELQQEHLDGFSIGPTSWGKNASVSFTDEHTLSKYSYIIVDNTEDYFGLTSSLSDFCEEYNYDSYSDDTENYMQTHDTYVAYISFKDVYGSDEINSVVLRLSDSELLNKYKEQFDK